jgi:uncharacterized protein DUF3618
MTPESDRSLDEIEIEIARTRARLSTTTDALAAELAPPRLIHQGADMLSGFLSRSDGIEVGGGVRADPVALALVGLGVAWLIAENTGLLDRLMPDRIPEIAEPTRPAERITALPATETPQSDRGEGWIHQVASATQGALHTVYDRGGAVIGQAGELISHPGEAGGRMIEVAGRTPWLIGLLGLAAGAAVAMLLPTSRREIEIAIQARDEIRDRAEELGHRAASSMRELAESSAHAAEESTTRGQTGR